MNPDSKKLRERLKLATREAILDAAQAEFSAQGFAAGRMEEIARRAGVSVGTVYNHYNDRAALLEALLDRHRGMLLARVDRALERTARESFEARLHAFVGSVLEHFEEHRALVSVAIEEELGGGRRGAKKGQVLVELSARAEALVAAGVKERVLRSDDAPMFGTFLVGILRSVALRAVKTGQTFSAPLFVALIVNFFFDGARARK